ncbi:MAG: HigA family addiction module antitoxin [Nitrospirae bacterium]|nr:HigA family addiction module antitoxin [Nitrospirota bacterium]MDA1305524.1 HigA family addiction module antitoxin [Nitrospirota bacterium]
MLDRLTDVPPPGYFIREELEAREWTQRDLAYVLGITEQAVNMIISGKRGISADMARALGDAFDVPPEFFANLQKAYDLSQARDPDPSVARKAKLQSKYPVREMIKRGWLVDANAALLETQMSMFFEVSNTEEIPHFAHAAKKTHYTHATPAQVAWLFRVRQIAKEIPVPNYSEKTLRGSLPQFHQFMIDPEETRYVPNILSECGVRFVVVEALPGSKIDGVCFWLGKSPVIGMSIQRDRIDNFWFVLRHEIEHILHKHGKDSEIIDADIEGDQTGLSSARAEEERVANLAASEFCVPVSQMDDFIKRKSPFFSERDVVGFARRLQIHPGIVAGQLRKRLDRWDLFSRMLVKVRHNVTSGAMVDGWGHNFPVSV